MITGLRKRRHPMIRARQEDYPWFARALKPRQPLECGLEAAVAG